MGHTIVTFHLESDDPDHDTGVTEETFLRVTDAIASVGGDDAYFEYVEDD